MSATVATGDGNASEFVRVAEAELSRKLSFTPYHGTLNLTGRRDDIVNGLPHAFVNDVGDDDYCTGIELYVCRIDGVLASVIVPEVPGYPDDKVELLAPVHLRSLFGLADGDTVCLDPPETLADPPAYRVNPDALDSFGAVIVHGSLLASATSLPAHLTDLDDPVGVCTRGPASTAEAALERFGDGQTVDTVVGQEPDDERPTLERVLHCLDELGVEPGTAVFVTADRDALGDVARAPFSILEANAVTEES